MTDATGTTNTDINPNVLPGNIPEPQDDGGTDHLTGAKVADITLPATSGENINLARLAGRTVLYIYPRTGVPGIPNPEGWDMIPGARGCTPQSCSFRDHFDELRQLGVDHLFGLSTQDTAYQREAATRLHLPFPLLSDERLELTRAMSLPTFDAEGMTLIKRMALVVDGGAIVKVFYPVFPPDRSAAMVIDWLQASR
jgi:peroxiredoxin